MRTPAPSHLELPKLLISLAIALPAAEAGAGLTAEQIANAEAHANTGRGHFAAKRYGDALVSFKSALAVNPEPTYDCYIGLTYVRLGRPHRGQYYMARCRTRGQGRADLPGWLGDELALTEQALRASEGHAPITLTSSALGTQITLTPAFDASEPLPLPMTVWVPLGEHTVEARFPKEPALKRRLTISDRSPRRVALEPAPPSCQRIGCPAGQQCVADACVEPTCDTVRCPAHQQCAEGRCIQATLPNGIETSSPQPGGTRSGDTAAWIVTLSGGALVATGAVIGLIAIADRQDLDSRKAEIPPSDVESENDRLETQGILSWSLLGAGAVTTYLGLTMFDDDGAPVAWWDGESSFFGWRGRWP